MKKLICFYPDKSYGTDTSVKEWLSANPISQHLTGPAVLLVHLAWGAILATFSFAYASIYNCQSSQSPMEVGFPVALKKRMTIMRTEMALKIVLCLNACSNSTSL